MTEQAIRRSDATLRDTAPVLLLVGSGFRPYREYILAAVSQHYRLWLLDSSEATWQLTYCEGATRVDTRDPEALREAAEALTTSLPVVGVFTYDESQVVFCARLAQDLGLPGSPPEAVSACRDKATTRSVLTAAGVPQPASRTVTNAQEALAAAEEIGYPVIVKARAMAGSAGVVRVDSAGEVADAFAAADGTDALGLSRHEENVLVEEFLTGPEISIDAVVHGGEVTPTVLARKRLGGAPYFVETGHDVDAQDPLLGDEDLMGQLQEIHRALGYVDGATHSEFKLTPQGPRLVEVNARLGGDLIPYVGLLASGVDPTVAAAHVAAGRKPDTTPEFRRFAGIRFLPPERTCEVVEVVVHEERFGPTIHETRVTARPGGRLAPPPEAFLTRYAHVVAVGEDQEQVLADLEAPERLVELRARALTD
ncbi:ATP-grasp domain-containing protein [Streptomyces sp. DSM 42041]|uniref:ATP-grasp domain-containing protein n=1 Tax=Streptomyces hazeniae TaxID=3075538 RepID=A0ABU2NWI1_9ACTN|nr:ATP-grasp domain-containing protein [Streptomyces sp. DSM 42041]MDT0380961.1 ATP-grasp domain-containing protein [Streptomyces sp. DSM 42041]